MRSGLILSFLAGALALQLGGCSDGDQAGQQQQQQAPQQRAPQQQQHQQAPQQQPQVQQPSGMDDFDDDIPF